MDTQVKYHREFGNTEFLFQLQGGSFEEGKSNPKSTLEGQKRRPMSFVLITLEHNIMITYVSEILAQAWILLTF